VKDLGFGVPHLELSVWGSGVYRIQDLPSATTALGGISA
jgi:hypothetical protein